ncbi:MAG: energy transducer TonB [Gammaproteobacteria bacterium]
MDNTFDTGMGSSGRKATILAIIVVFHILLMWGLVTSLGIIQVDRPPPPIIAEILEDLQDEDEPPPPPPAIETPPPYVPPPDIVVEVPVDAPVSTALVVTNVKPVAAPPPAPTGVRVAAKLDKRFERRLKPEYPPTSKRLGEQGLVTVECLVNLEGKCQEIKLKSSSGFPRLDEAVLKHAPRAWKFIPATVDGKPVEAWITVPIRFKVEDG